MTEDLKYSIEPWLSVHDGAAAVAFYIAAFGAAETYRLEIPGGGLVARLSAHGAGFWVSSDGETTGSETKIKSEGVRMILIVADPYPLFNQAISAGATEIFPVGEGHGWVLGRLADPFGLHWEIGHPLSSL